MQAISDSSRKIGEIISAIDGIAIQTNILALNAAVEATRAGTEGRGFAVVAGEVRLLAHRSAEAAREINALVGSSAAEVELGGQLVEEARLTIGSIFGQVEQVNAMITEISQACQEQRSGIEQIGNAVDQLDHVTQQNAALVEESAAASESLRQQADRLTHTVSRFRLAAG
jgi:methyl-accepting chemotaxis protein